MLRGLLVLLLLQMLGLLLVLLVMGMLLVLLVLLLVLLLVRVLMRLVLVLVLEPHQWGGEMNSLLPSSPLSQGQKRGQTPEHGRNDAKSTASSRASVHG